VIYVSDQVMKNVLVGVVVVAVKLRCDYCTDSVVENVLVGIVVVAVKFRCDYCVRLGCRKRTCRCSGGCCEIQM
jgi:hypothetical protein